MNHGDYKHRRVLSTKGEELITKECILNLERDDEILEILLAAEMVRLNDYKKPNSHANCLQLDKIGRL